MAEFFPLKVTFRLKTPVVVGTYPLTLDSLLSAVAAFEESGGDRRPPRDALYARRPDLPLAKAAGPGGRWIWRASAGFFGPVAYPVRVGYVRIQPYTETPFYRGPRPSEGTGAYRKYKVSHFGLATPEMRFWAVGDPDGVARLLARVPGLGKKRAAGWGAVAGFTVEEVPDWGGYGPEDYGLWLRPEDAVPGGKINAWRRGMFAARPIPVSLVPPERRDWGVAMWCAARPPYWDRVGMELCLVPPYGAHIWSSGAEAFRAPSAGRRMASPAEEEWWMDGAEEDGGWWGAPDFSHINFLRSDPIYEVSRPS